jgi:hypothetical protein
MDDRLRRLTDWGLVHVRGRGIARELVVNAWQMTLLVDPTEETIDDWDGIRVDVYLEAPLVADPSVSLHDLKVVLGHELGSVVVLKQCRQLRGKARELKADELPAALGLEVIPALRRLYAARPRWNKPSRSHPSLDERIANLEVWYAKEH